MMQTTLFPLTEAKPAVDFSARRYSIGVWCLDRNRYLPWRMELRGPPTVNLTLAELRAVMRDHRKHNEGAWGIKAAGRVRLGSMTTRAEARGDSLTIHSPPEDFEKVHEWDCDTDVIVERTDGMPLGQILERWKR